MYARIVRFTDVDPDNLSSRRDSAFRGADDMAAAEGPLDSMDPGETPGTRASVDRCEIKAEVGGG
jgi:hypothetical protein